MLGMFDGSLIIKKILRAWQQNFSSIMEPLEQSARKYVMELRD